MNITITIKDLVSRAEYEDVSLVDYGPKWLHIFKDNKLVAAIPKSQVIIVEVTHP